MATNHFFPWLCDDHIEMIIHDHLMITMTDDHTKMTTYLPKKTYRTFPRNHSPKQKSQQEMQPQLFIFSMFQLNKQSHQGICFSNSHLNIHPSLSPSHWELTQWLVAILPLPAADISKPYESRIMRHDCQVGGFLPTHLKKYAIHMRTSNWIHLPQGSGSG